jgi:hypothetical protein
MSVNTVVNGQIVRELSKSEFERGLYRLAGENSVKYNSLRREFKTALLDDVIKTTQAKNKGINKQQRAYNRIRDREGRLHRQRLNDNMLKRHSKKPKNTDAHHVVSWNHPDAVGARAILERFGIDVDSADNGVYLPSKSKYVPHPDMPNAYSHKKIHTKVYYVNLTEMLADVSLVPNANKEDIIDVLDEIANELVNGKFPIR